MQRFASFGLIITLAASALATQRAAIPRKSPEFTISEPSGKTTLLSSFKGKVVVIEFLFVRSPHCLRVAQTMNRLQVELGPRGFQPVGIVFDPPSTGAFNPDTSRQFVTQMVDYFKLTYPVGYATRTNVDSYLGQVVNGVQVFNVPQVVVIDRAGMVRVASGGRGGDPKLENENSLRKLIETLLKEPAPTAAAK